MGLENFFTKDELDSCRKQIEILVDELARKLFAAGKIWSKIEPPRDKTNKMACAPSEDSDQSGHPPGLIRVFALRSVGS